MQLLKANDQLEYYENDLGYNCSYDFPIIHTHDYWEFVYVKHEIKHFINGQNTVVQDNSVLIIKPTDSHLIRGIDSPANPDKEPTHLNIKITNNLLNQILSAVDPYAIDCILKKNNLIKPINIEASMLFSKFLNYLMWSSNKEKNILILKSVISYIFALFFDIIYADDIAQNNIPIEIENLIKKMNSKNYLTCPLSEITKNSNYSYMQLTRLFKKYTGYSMSEYFLNIRLDNALTEIKTTNRLILDISNDIGISSLSHFNHIFKSKYGIAPGEYRKKRTL